MNFISSRSILRGILETDIVILGPTKIGEGSLVCSNVIIGYPTKAKLISGAKKGFFGTKAFDDESNGSSIGKDCIIRSGTIIYENVNISDGAETGHNVLIREGSRIGRNSLVGSSTKLDGTVRIGKDTRVQSNVYLPHLTVIEDKVFIGPKLCITNDLYPPREDLKGVWVESKAILGANSTILAGVRIGYAAVVGAGSVVTKDVPSETVVIGNPAKFHMTRKGYEKKRLGRTKYLRT
jgi:acetyltransferase-like isoleucine patch superfamily enzyme